MRSISDWLEDKLAEEPKETPEAPTMQRVFLWVLAVLSSVMVEGMLTPALQSTQWRMGAWTVQGLQIAHALGMTVLFMALSLIGTYPMRPWYIVAPFVFLIVLLPTKVAAIVGVTVVAWTLMQHYRHKRS
jgi:hypothetical protein